MDFKTLMKLEAENPSKLLNRLNKQVELESGKNNPLLPNVSIGLHGGVFLNGYLLDYSENSGDVLLGQIIEGKADLKFCNAGNIISLELHNSKPYLFSLSNGAIPFIPAEQDIPSGLELKRLIKEANDEINSYLINDVSLSFSIEGFRTGMDFYTAKLLLKTIKEVILQVVDNELGKEAIQESVNQIVVEFGEQNKVTIQGGELLISCKPENGPTLPWAMHQIKTEIEEQL